MQLVEGGRSCEGQSSLSRVTLDDMLVVSVQLGESFLENGTPQRRIFADMPEHGLPAVRLVRILDFLQREEVINQDCMLHAQRIQIDPVNAIRVQAVGRIEEYFLQTMWFLCQSACNRHKPAVSDGVLPDVHRGDASTAPKGMLIRKYVTGPMPLYLVHILGQRAVGLIRSPKQGMVGMEISVMEKETLRIKVWNGFFVAIMG